MLPSTHARHLDYAFSQVRNRNSQFSSAPLVDAYPRGSGYAVAHLLWVSLVDPKQQSAIFNYRPHGIEDPVITDNGELGQK